MYSGFTFNGVHSSTYLLMNGKATTILPSISPRLLTVPGRDGAYDIGRTVGVRKFDITVTISAQTQSDYNEVKRQIAAWLLTDQPAPLIFDDEPDKTYYARLSGDTSLTELFRFGTGTLTLVAPDPYAYGPTITQTINDPSGGETNPVVLNDGTAETYPVFKATILQPTTFLQIISPNSYMQAGQPYEVGQAPYEAETLILHDDMSTITGWGAADSVDSGYISGTMASDGDAFYPSSFGTAIDPPMWQGPALKKSLSEAVQDFRMDALVALTNVGYETGLIEIYLKDAANNTVGKIAIEDAWVNTIRTHGKAQIGGADGSIIADTYADGYTPWNNYDGIIRLERRGNVWHPYFSLIKDGVHTRVRGTIYYTDMENLYMNEVTQIQVAMRKWPGTVECPMRVKDIKVWKLNTPGQQQVPYIAVAGDVLTFDHKRALILKNGEPFLAAKDFGASFFPLNPGETELAINPSDAAKVDVTYRGAWK